MSIRVFFALLITILILSSPDVHSQSVQVADQGDTSTIRIMSYNIKMLPRVLRYIHHKPVQRAKIIPSYLIAENTDIIVLEEAFDDRCVGILKRKLNKVYPYHLGPVNMSAGTTFSGGAMIFSKTPLKRLHQVRFKACSGNDCLAHKGALLAETTVKGHTIQVLGTHLQAGGIPAIKRSQYAQIEEMLEHYAKNGVPQILGGDYNTFRTDTVLYPAMLNTLKAEDGPITGDMQFTSDDVICDMSENYCRVLSHYEQDIIDYILYKGNGKPYKSVTRHITRYMTPWDIDHRDLSDHMTLIMDLKL